MFKGFYSLVIFFFLISNFSFTHNTHAQTGLESTAADYARAYIDIKNFTNRPDNISREKWFNEYLKAFFPTYKRGRRFVVIPPQFSEEERKDWLVEIRLGKKTTIQPCGDHVFHNHFTIGSHSGRFRDKRDVRMPYYVGTIGEIERSILFCTLAREERFVDGKGIKINLEHDLPLFFYIPADATAHYRFWKANTKEFKKAAPFREYYIIKDSGPVEVEEGE